MLNSLEIRNYRNLKHLRIEKLGRVNLVIGKNNVGKTSLLEAISVCLGSDELSGDANMLFSLLAKLTQDREEVPPVFYNPPNNDFLEYNRNILKMIFSNRSIKFGSEIVFFGNKIMRPNLFFENLNISIKIGAAYNELQYTFQKNEKGESIQVPYYVQRITYDENILPNIPSPEFIVNFEIIRGGERKISNIYLRTDYRGYSHQFNFPTRLAKVQFIRTRNFIRDVNPALFDNASFDNEKEARINEALRIIEPKVEKIGFQTIEGNIRAGKVKVSGYEELLPLGSLGDGINRILTIILAMVNCESGYLLIDEFENGLHYSVQEKLWEIIFHLSEQLNIQVFATTHSNDTIRSFTKIANDKESDGYLVKLRNINGEIDAVVFNESELQIAAEAEYLDLRI